MTQCIVYKLGDGVAVINPAEGVLVNDLIGLVPTGVPYLIMNISSLPPTREDRDAWTADFSNPDGFGPVQEEL
jgi:hypothetical protein